MLTVAARKELDRIAKAKGGLPGAEANLRSAPALVRRGLAKVEIVERRPYYVITIQGQKALSEDLR